MLPKTIFRLYNLKKIYEYIFDKIRHGIDFFYPPFRKFMSLQLFRYAFSGAINLLFDWILYPVIYIYILQQKMLELGFVTISSHIAALGFKFPIVLISGFLLQKNVTFIHSELKGRLQLFRYFIVVIINLFFNYVGFKLLVDHLNFDPTYSNIIISISTIGISYFSQKHYTFKALNKIQTNDESY